LFKLTRSAETPQENAHFFSLCTTLHQAQPILFKSLNQ